MPFFLTGVHGNVARVENPLEVVSGLPRGNGFNIIGRRSASTWVSSPIQAPQLGDKMTDIRVVADLGESVTLRRVHVWISGSGLVFHAGNLHLTGSIDKIFPIPGDPELGGGISVSLALEFGSSGNDSDRRAIIRSSDTQLEEEDEKSPGYALKKAATRRLSSTWSSW